MATATEPGFFKIEYTTGDIMSQASATMGGYTKASPPTRATMFGRLFAVMDAAMSKTGSGRQFYVKEEAYLRNPVLALHHCLPEFRTHELPKLNDLMKGKAEDYIRKELMWLEPSFVHDKLSDQEVKELRESYKDYQSQIRHEFASSR